MDLRQTKAKSQLKTLHMQAIVWPTLVRISFSELLSHCVTGAVFSILLSLWTNKLIHFSNCSEKFKLS